MIIKEVLLEEERQQIIIFLEKFNLKLDNDVTKTIYIEDNEKIIGTISCTDYIIKCLAVDPTYQSENIASKLVNEMIQYFAYNNIYSYQVFTKPLYKNIFISFGFKKIVETERVIMLEGGTNSIEDELKKIKKQLDIRFAELTEKSDIAAIVINGNPLTNGHVHLIEEASLRHKMVVVFIVEENKSYFTFQERLGMAYLATKRFSNVCVIPSTKYIVSSLTFPSYFLKNDLEVNEEYSKIDALIFNEYFIDQLYIKKRYVGEETNNKMIGYNNILKEILGDKLEIIPRYHENNQIVSASLVRKLIEEKNIDEALKYIPKENQIIFKSIVQTKYEK